MWSICVLWEFLWIKINDKTKSDWVVLYEQNNFHNGWYSLLPVVMTEAIQMMTGLVQNVCICMEACPMQ